MSSAQPISAKLPTQPAKAAAKDVARCQARPGRFVRSGVMLFAVSNELWKWFHGRGHR